MKRFISLRFCITKKNTIQMRFETNIIFASTFISYIVNDGADFTTTVNEKSLETISKY